MTSASALEYRSRYELVEEARSLGVERPERMTMQELKDEILRLTLSEEEQQGARGLFGVARAMLAGVVEAGLKMPDAARLIRGDVTLEVPARSRSPVATVTLAEIYAAQGHLARALSVLDEVLASEPDHEEALRIRRGLATGEGARVEAPATDLCPPEASFRGSARGSVSAASSRSEPGWSEPGWSEPGWSEPEPEKLASASGFPSTEYVPVDVVETTGHESAESAGAWIAVPPSDSVVAPPADEVAPPVEEVAPPADEVAPPVGEIAASGGDASGAASLLPSESQLESREPEPFESDALARESTGEALTPILAVEQRGSTICLYWELSPEMVTRSGLDESEGVPALVVVAFTASGPNPLRDQRSLPLVWQAPFAGTLVVSDLGPHAAVRAAVGWRVEGAFLPLAVGRTLERLATESPAAAARAQLAMSGLLPRA